MKKIFGIGLSRTGTSSLADALNYIGFDILHYPDNLDELFSSDNDGACDIPTAIYFKELDKKFPNSKFIYTIRNKETWLASMESHFKRRRDDKVKPWQAQNRKLIYGQINFNKDLFSIKYDIHDKNVREYFKERDNDLLILNICDGDGWDKLLSFVDKPNANISEAFPHSNKRKL